jgi:hypothetical protein
MTAGHRPSASPSACSTASSSWPSARIAACSPKNSSKALGKTSPRWPAPPTRAGATSSMRSTPSTSGHRQPRSPTGFNGGLFRDDPLVDDLDLDDRWAERFQKHRRLRLPRRRRNQRRCARPYLRALDHRTGKAARRRPVRQTGRPRPSPPCPRSAERKRFGIYYTPPQFTRLIVEETLGKLIAERVESAARSHAASTARRRVAQDQGRRSRLRLGRVPDRRLRTPRRCLRGNRPADAQSPAIFRRLNLTNEYPDYIPSINLYGVDLSGRIGGDHPTGPVDSIRPQRPNR